LLRPDFIGIRNDKRFRFTPLLSLIVLTMFISSCGPKEIVPVELYPEDECAACRMAVSSPEFASEIINVDGTVVKFDDLRCFENYRKTHTPDEFAAIFVMNYDTKQWMPFGKSIVIQTSIETPMGSGQVAVGDQQRANQLKEQYPSTVAAMDGDACCAPKK
jgi:copper chaperone NosL